MKVIHLFNTRLTFVIEVQATEKEDQCLDTNYAGWTDGNTNGAIYFHIFFCVL